jgi:sialate O-acetylesterase
MGKWAALAVSLACGLSGCASLQIPSLSAPAKRAALLYADFQDHAVLQREKPIALWGTAKPASHVSVALAGEMAEATADASGKWRVTLAPLKAGGPYELTVTSDAEESQTLKDILIGDVFLCSGQSNMEMPVRIASNYDADLNGAANPMIRLMLVHRFANAAPTDKFGAEVTWNVVSPATVREFSAACYYFGRELQPAVDVPIGLISDSWGGSLIEAWLSKDRIRELGGYDKQLDVLAHYAAAPEQSLNEWRDFSNEWWRAHDPASGAHPAWSDPAFDDSAWAQIIPAGWWEGWGVKPLRDFDGIVWFRVNVTLSAAQARGDAVLSLGPVDDNDSTWINGIAIGAGEGWDTKRVYKVPAGTLHEGKNLIAVGVLDMGAGGGMWGPATDKTLKLGDGSTIVLDTPWRYQISAPLKQTGSMLHAPWLAESGLSMLYNGMIVPLGPVGLRGAVWYQGESNTADAKKYAPLLKGVIADARHQFGADLPFLIVQLPDFGPAATKPEDSNWADLREQQRLVAQQVPNTGLVVTIDIGQRDNIHPTDKQAVGARLALLARQMIYVQAVEGTAPAPVSALRVKDKLTIGFVHTDKGLVVYESNRPMGFQVCNAAKHCDFVDATLDRDQIVIDLAQHRDASKVRFCWADSPICNLYSSEDIPAVPFEMPITDATRARK